MPGSRKEAAVKSRRQRLLEGMRRTLNDLLEQRAKTLARTRGWPRSPVNTGAIYTLTATGASGLLDQLLHVHHMVEQEEGEIPSSQPYAPPVTDSERRRMLSAIRATVRQSGIRGR